MENSPSKAPKAVRLATGPEEMSGCIEETKATTVEMWASMKVRLATCLSQPWPHLHQKQDLLANTVATLERTEDSMESSSDSPASTALVKSGCSWERLARYPPDLWDCRWARLG